LTCPVICDVKLQAQQAGAACKQFAVGNHDDARRQAPACEPDTQVRTNARRLTRRYRDERSVKCGVLNVEWLKRRNGRAADNLTLET
jgi:hypothetical protein